MSQSRLSSPPSRSSSLSPSDFSSDVQAGVGLSDPSLSSRRRRALDLINELHNTGVDVDVDLPVIAVVGSQSAGKSSLIEAISGITLPRASGTCTRVPTECRLSHSNQPWKCIVSLRFLTDDKGQRLGQPKNITFGPSIHEKSEVEERIRRAQRAILNPSRDPQEFIDGEDEDPTNPQLTFSTNCISLQISGPDVADLSFCDLPGLIANVGASGNTGDIQLVENLVKSYIERESCIILLAITCETDFNNQAAYEFARNVDPERERTIGVLTKPDRIPPGDEDYWLRLIRNESEALDHNWYCVKQPDGKALKSGITWEEARRREDEFFSLTAPWSTLDASYQKYLRTSNLTERLSAILSELISKRLPIIDETLQDSLKETQDRLSDLPKAPSSDPFSEVLNLIHLFIRDVEHHVEGRPNPDGLLQTLRPFQKHFKETIFSTLPDFRPYESSSPQAASKPVPPPRFLDSDELDVYSNKCNDSTAIWIEEVMERAESARTRELPGTFPFVAQAAFITKVTQTWSAPAYQLHEEARAALVKSIYELVDMRLSDVGRGVIARLVRLIMAEHMGACTEHTKERIEDLIRMEGRPRTVNNHLYMNYRENFLVYYKGLREEDKHPTLLAQIRQYNQNRIYATGVSKVLNSLNELRVDCTADELAKLLPKDPMDPALTIMASVQAYFQVAYKRFADNIVIAIDDHLVLGTTQGLERALMTGLGLTGPEGRRKCAEFVQEPRSIASRRKELNAKRERLEAGRRKLIELGSI